MSVLEYLDSNCIRNRSLVGRISSFLPKNWRYSLTDAFGMVALIVTFALKQAKHIGMKNFRATGKGMPKLMQSLGLPGGLSLGFGSIS